ncbi:Male-specific lethal 1-like protein [Nibea albiflora]|uniref:Male-specific lethal 1-like protein n=1 Tax=Nibea albiflora TaxID=240163 RepID=A0ACB7F3T1_NIBAL|nr:Male-specific lethal 1-like protein [Nibea albiflora]
MRSSRRFETVLRREHVMKAVCRSTSQAREVRSYCFIESKISLFLCVLVGQEPANFSWEVAVGCIAEALQHEKSSSVKLLARIERMERRLQLTRKDPPRDKPDKEDMWDLDVEERTQANPATPHPFSRGGKGQKRKSCFGDPKNQKSRSKSAKLSPQKSDIQPRSSNQRELRSKETPEKTVPVRSTSQAREVRSYCFIESKISLFLCVLVGQEPANFSWEVAVGCIAEALQHEKSSSVKLLARIERMERRLQLTRKDPPRDKRLFQPLEPWTPDKEDMWDLDVEERTQANPATPHPFSRGGKGQKRKSCFGDPKNQKSRSKSAKLSPQKSDIQPRSSNQRELRSKETPEKTVPVRSAAERDIMLPCKEEPEPSCQIEDLPFMSTTESVF